jgi:LacI family transcriptional regulator
MPATIKDIAKEAGVSSATVSKVLHDSSSSVRVSPKTAGVVREIAERLGYVPNANARTLKSTRTRTIGLYFDDLAGIASGPLYTTYLIDGICKVVFKRHYRLALVAELDDLDATRSLSDGRLDGAIWCRVVRDQRTLEAMADAPIPIVAMSSVPAGPRVFTVSCDNVGGIDGAVDHLVSLGHRRIMFLSESWEALASDRIDRQEAFFRAMASRDLKAEPADAKLWSWDLTEFRDWWATRPPHTAVVCWSERCAGELLKRCHEVGVSVPHDLSVIGFDSTRFCETTSPPLTAVRQPIIQMGELAAQLLLSSIESGMSDQKDFVLPCPLDLRMTTAGPRPLKNP